MSLEVKASFELFKKRLPGRVLYGGGCERCSQIFGGEGSGGES